MGLNITAYAVIISFLLGSLGSGGLVWHYRDLRDASQREKVVEHAGVVVKALQAKADTVEAAQIQVQNKVEVRYETIEKSIPIYIHDINPPVSVNFVSLHNNAASPDLPSTPAISPDAPSTIDSAQAIGTISHNYAICESTKQELIGWQEWWKSVKDTK